MSRVPPREIDWEGWRRKMEAGVAVRGRAVAARSGYVKLDLGADVPARARRKDLVPRPGSTEAFDRFLGREIEGLVIFVEPEARGVVVSPRHLSALRFGEALREGRKVSGRVVEANRGGLMVEVDGAIGFVPRPHLPRDQAGAHHLLVGGPWTGYVIKATQRKFVLSPNRPPDPTPQVERPRKGKIGAFLARLPLR